MSEIAQILGAGGLATAGLALLARAAPIFLRGLAEYRHPGPREGGNSGANGQGEWRGRLEERLLTVQQTLASIVQGQQIIERDHQREQIETRKVLDRATDVLEGLTKIIADHDARAAPAITAVGEMAEGMIDMRGKLDAIHQKVMVLGEAP